MRQADPKNTHVINKSAMHNLLRKAAATDGGYIRRETVSKFHLHGKQSAKHPPKTNVTNENRKFKE